MKAGRELDYLIAEKVMGYPIKRQKREVFEATPKGTRPVVKYSTDIEAAWEVAERFGVTLIPVQENAWFGLVRPEKDFSSPDELVDILKNKNFTGCGAAAADTAPLTICLAALRAFEAQQGAGVSPMSEGPDAGTPPPTLTH
ncbi:MAG: BC1872 family protein [Bdellovibrionota bacterium]